MTKGIRWRVTANDLTIACVAFTDTDAKFDARRAVREMSQRADGPTSLVEGLLALRFVDGSDGRRGRRPFRLCAVGEEFDAHVKVIYRGDEAMVASGRADKVPARLVRDGRGVRDVVEGPRADDDVAWYEAFWSERGGYGYVDLRDTDGGSTVAGMPGSPEHPMSSRQAEELAARLNERRDRDGAVAPEATGAAG